MKIKRIVYNKLKPIDVTNVINRNYNIKFELTNNWLNDYNNFNNKYNVNYKNIFSLLDDKLIDIKI